MTVRLDETRIRAAENLPTHTVGTLKASLAERYLGELGVTDIKTYDNQAHPYMDLLLGRLDAVVMDTPIALYYAYGQQFHNVELASTKFPIAIGIRKDDTEASRRVECRPSTNEDGRNSKDHLSALGPLQLFDRRLLRRPQPGHQLQMRIDTGITSMRFKRSGHSRRTTATVPVVRAALASRRPGHAGDFYRGHGGRHQFRSDAGLVRVFGSRWLAWPAVAFIEVIRGTPLLIQLFIIFYGLPSLGIRLTPLWAAILGLGTELCGVRSRELSRGHPVRFREASWMRRWRWA